MPIKNRNIAPGEAIKDCPLDLSAITASVAEINKLDNSGAVVASGTTAEAIANLTDSATGEEIAAAVNAVIAALVAFKIVAPAPSGE